MIERLYVNNYRCLVNFELMTKESQMDSRSTPQSIRGRFKCCQSRIKTAVAPWLFY